MRESVPGCDQPLLGDISQGVFRPLVPVGFRKKIFDLLHALSHPGVRASQKLVSQRFVWFGMRSDIRTTAAIEIPSIATNVGLSAHPDEEPAPEFRSPRGKTIRHPVRYRRSLDD